MTYEPIVPIVVEGKEESVHDCGKLLAGKIIAKVWSESAMGMAVGMIETVGYPAVLAASDAMLKAGRVALVNYERVLRVQHSRSATPLQDYLGGSG